MVAHLQVDLCPVTSADQGKNCAREAHRDSVTSTHILQMLFILLVFYNKERQYLTKIDNGITPHTTQKTA